MTTLPSQLLLTLLFLAACGGTSPRPDAGAYDQPDPSFQRTLDDLPVCGPGANPQVLSLQATCTEKFCTYQCCNACTITDPPAFLGLPAWGFDCQVKDWNAALELVPVDVDAGCRAP